MSVSEQSELSPPAVLSGQRGAPRGEMGSLAHLWDFHAPEQKSLSVSLTHTHKHTHTNAQSHTHTHARMHAQAPADAHAPDTHTQTQTQTLWPHFYSLCL